MSSIQPDLDSGLGSEDDFQNLNDITCNCELCHARMYVSMKQGIDEDYFIFLNHPNMGDGFHIIPQSSQGFYPCNHQLNGQLVQYSWPFQYSYLGELQPSPCSVYGNCPCLPDARFVDEAIHSNINVSEISFRISAKSTNAEAEVENSLNSSPQVFISKDSVIHIRLSNYVAIEFSGSAYRLINYRNNSAIALSDSGEYGYAYHYNCRGLINMHHEKLSIAFDRERQVLLRSEKPSFVKKEQDYYRLASNYWSSCRPVTMDNFDKDRTPDILKKISLNKSCDENKLKELVNSSIMHPENGGLTIFLGDAKIEQKVNGDVQLNWFYEDRANCLIVSPLAGSFSLSTKNLEIITTPKNDIYISFVDFFIQVSNQQMTVSYGSSSNGKVGSVNTDNNCHSSVLNLTSSPMDQNISPSGSNNLSFIQQPFYNEACENNISNKVNQPSTESSVLQTLSSNICIKPNEIFKPPDFPYLKRSENSKTCGNNTDDGNKRNNYANNR